MNKSTSNETDPGLSTSSTVSSNPWDIERDPTGANRFDNTGWGNAKEFARKYEYLRSSAREGRCYIWLLLYIDKLQQVEWMEFVEFVDYVLDQTGRRPIGEDAVVGLLTACMLKIYPDGTDLSGRSLSIELINHMMNSKVRMTYEDADVLHIEPASVYSCGCLCREVLCEHGWSARYIVIILQRTRKRVGATINFDDVVFEDDDEGSFQDTRSHLSESTIRIDQPRAKEVPLPLFSGGPASHQTIPPPPQRGYSRNLGQANYSKVRRVQTLPVHSASQPGKGHPPVTLGGLDAMSRLATVVRAAAEVSKVADDRQKVGRDKKGIEDEYLRRIKDVIEEIESLDGPETQVTESDIGPDDSSSNFGVRRAKQGTYMPQGSTIEEEPEYPSGAPTTLTAQTGRRQDSNIALYKSPNMEASNVIQGYMKTPGMLKDEESAISSICLINGLCMPFRSERLNFLAHVYTALNTRKIKVDDPESLCEGLIRVSQSSGKTTSEKLLISVINSTFNVDRMVVLSNAFKLPYIEVGMSISGAMLTKCFVQLTMEYEVAWFGELKGLRIPEFHSRFYSISESDPNTKSKVNTRSKHVHSSGKEKRHEARSRASSLLGFSK